MCAESQGIDIRWCEQLESAAVVYLPHHPGIEITPTALASLRGVARSTIYRRAQSLLPACSSTGGNLPPRELLAENTQLRQRVAELEASLSPYQQGTWVQVTDERLALTSLEMSARDNSVEDIKATLKVAFSLEKPPADGTIQAILARGAGLAEQVLDSVVYHYPLDTVQFDELYHAGQPLLVMIEPYSMGLMLLESLGNATAATWRFAVDYRAIEPPFLMAHDCSPQGNLLVKQLEKKSQLCLWHRQREITRELAPALDDIYHKALDTLNQSLWEAAVDLEQQLAEIVALTSPLDFCSRTIRRFESAVQEFRAALKTVVEHLDWLQKLWGKPLNVPSLRGWHVRSAQFLAHLKKWDLLAQEVEFRQGVVGVTGYDVLDALAAVTIGEKALTMASQQGNGPGYWDEQRRFLQDCTRLRLLQAQCKNYGAIEQKFRLMVVYVTRTTSLVEALNRRLRGFTDAKRQVTERQLRLLQLHHNTTPFTKDAKRAGKSPWQWLELDVPGLDEGFVGVLKAANTGKSWPSPWAFKA